MTTWLLSFQSNLIIKSLYFDIFIPKFLKNNFKEIITLPDNILLLVQHLLLTNRLRKGYYELRKYSAKHRKYLCKRVLAE